MKNLDKLAYDVVCNWPKEINFNPVFDGIDYSQIIRFYLWDKVGRAIRIQNNISYNEVEPYLEDYKSSSFYDTPQKSKGRYRRNFLNRKKSIFIPFQTSHTSYLIQKLQESKRYKVISKHETKQITKANVIKQLDFDCDKKLGGKLYRSVLEALDSLNVELITEDKELLRSQIEGAVEITALAERELLKYKPNAVYVHSDNHPPFINYVLVAKKLNIPTFMYQHGLDCEQYYLDDCYADHVAVWSKNRKDRYVKDSLFQPKNYSIIGNVLLSKQTPIIKATHNNTIVLVTRPHKPIKCYSPSRYHLEGLEVLQVILEFLKKHDTCTLILKLHPMDYKEAYADLIKHNGLENRVTISEEKLIDVLKIASVVVTEDSTAGAEAMYYEVPCVHAHLSKLEPILPFVKYGCAFPGFSKEELALSLEKALSVNDNAMAEIMTCQKNFVKDFIPHGNVDSLVTYLSENII